MINRVMGKKVTKEYYINENSVGKRDVNGDKYYEYTGKPTLETKVINTDWEEICSFDTIFVHQFTYNITYGSYYNRPTINISEDESLEIENGIMRADLGEYHIHTNKILEEICDNKEQMESKYKMILGKFNKRMIEQDEKMSVYCKLNHWKPEDTDCEELWKIVHDCAFVYENGKMKKFDIRKRTLIDTDSGYGKLYVKNSNGIFTSIGD